MERAERQTEARWPKGLGLPGPAARGDEARPALPDRYRIVSRLGEGGTAEVFVVEDLSAGALRRAMKILRPETPPALLGAFRDEFRLLAGLEHPGLARVFEFGELPGGRAYYTAELVEGRELGRGPTPSAREACLVAAAVCRTLAYLHARGYVH